MDAERTERPSAFEALGAYVYRRRLATLSLAGAFLVASLVLLFRGGLLTSGSIDPIEATRATLLVERVLGHPPDTTFVVLLRSPSGAKPGDPAFVDAIDAAVADLRKDPAVLSVTTPREAGAFLGASMSNDDAREAFALVDLRGDLQAAIAAYPRVRAAVHTPPGFELECTGYVPFMHDLDSTLEKDLLRAELVSLPLAILVLLLVFRTAVAAVLPVGVGALAVVGGIALVVALSHVTDIAQYTINVCSLVGLGVAVDYSLFTVARYREELALGRTYEEALVRAVGRAGKVVAFSGGAVATGLAGLLFFEGSYLRAMGIGGAIVVALAVVFALTFLPALLAVLGPRIHAGKLPFVAARAPEGKGFLARWAARVMKRPILFLIPTLAVLVSMGVPFLHVRLAAADVRVLDADVEARRGYDTLVRDFHEAAQTRIEVVVEFPTAPALTRDRIGALVDLSRRVAALSGVARVESVVDGSPFPMTKDEWADVLLNPPDEAKELVEMGKRLTVGDRVVILHAVTDAPPDSEEARAIVREIRRDRAVGDGALQLGGEAANDLDTTDYVAARAPRAIAFVVGVTALVLLFLLGSVLLPIKAVLMNFVSIAGSFGALVWIFQDGHLWIRVPRPVEPSLPILLFCISFGLSMDYEVLMLSRMKESWDAHHDNGRAVGEGLEKTAGLITSAAAIMVAVFGAFAFARVVLIQAVGFGMALAVALDATLVRLLLVPATMRLFGDANWWAPRFVVAWRKRWGLDDVRH